MIGKTSLLLTISSWRGTVSKIIINEKKGSIDNCMYCAEYFIQINYFYELGEIRIVIVYSLFYLLLFSQINIYKHKK